MTLAHELGHLLYDPEAQLQRVRVDHYDQLTRDAQDSQFSDPIEQRANAFAVEFLAPMNAIRRLTDDVAELSAADIAKVMSTFGIGPGAARYHAWNAWWQQAPLPSEGAIKARPTYEQRAAEDLTLDYFPIQSVSGPRRGRFAVLIAEAVDAGLITTDTAAQNLGCTEAEVTAALQFILELG